MSAAYFTRLINYSAHRRPLGAFCPRVRDLPASSPMQSYEIGMRQFRRVLLIVTILHSLGTPNSLKLLQLPETEGEEQASPMDVVTQAEIIALRRNLSPTSILLLDLGSVLTQGSFSSNASLLSLRPRIPPQVDVHTELLEALAAPQKIFVVMSQTEGLRNKDFFASDFVQNIRHKFVFLLITRTESQDKRFRWVSGVFCLPTLLWSGKVIKATWCYENHDNVFWEYASKSAGDCGSRTSLCHFHSIYEPFLSLSGTLYIQYFFRFHCNVTRTELKYAVSYPRIGFQKFISMSQYNVRQVESHGCRSLIPIAHQDVTALLKPFELEVWCFILSYILLLTKTWSLLAREPSTPLLHQILMTTISAEGVKFNPRTLSSTVAGCSALVFTFLIGTLYSNCVMSSFLNPTTELPSTHGVKNCHGHLLCYDKKWLNSALRTVAVCQIPIHMLGAVTSPLRNFKARPFSFDGIMVVNLVKFNGRSRSLPLVPTQSSIIWNRMLQHGVVSPGRLLKVEVKTLQASKDKSSHLKKSGDQLGLYKLKTDLDNQVFPYTYASYESVGEWFDLHSFLKLWPLIGVCLIFIIGLISWELLSAAICQRIALSEARVRSVLHVIRTRASPDNAL